MLKQSKQWPHPDVSSSSTMGSGREGGDQSYQRGGQKSRETKQWRQNREQQNGSLYTEVQFTETETQEEVAGLETKLARRHHYRGYVCEQQRGS